MTTRIRFRRFTADDAGLLFDLDGDREVMRYLSHERTPLAAIQGTLLPGILQTYATYPGLGRFAAHDAESDEFLGWFSLDVDAREMARRPELGYRLHRQSWGRGLATEGGRALIDHAFGVQGVEAVFAQTMAVNLRSLRVMAKLGMRHVRSFHVDFDHPLPGTEEGEVEYEITRDAWLRQRRMVQGKG